MEVTTMLLTGRNQQSLTKPKTGFMPKKPFWHGAFRVIRRKASSGLNG
jgi:hypothetical protein